MNSWISISISLLIGLLIYPILNYFISNGNSNKGIAEEPHNSGVILEGYSGNIEGDNSFLGILRFLNKKKVCGILHLYIDRRKGYVIFRNGEIIDGFFRNLSKVNSIKVMLELDKGEYSFENRIIIQPNLINRNLEDIIKS